MFTAKIYKFAINYTKSIKKTPELGWVLLGKNVKLPKKRGKNSKKFQNLSLFSSD